jgi:hypothetical protein
LAPGSDRAARAAFWTDVLADMLYTIWLVSFTQMVHLGGHFA